MNRLKIVTGHFGSGKTEFALNLVMQAGGKRTIVDLDTVNPYYRTADAENILAQKGISLIAPQFANTNVDIPALPGAVLSVFADKEVSAVFDVGGDEDGALALGRYNRFFLQEPHDMYFVVNTKRPLTRTKEDILTILREVETASRLSVTHLVNSTNLGAETTVETILEGQEIVEEVSRETGIPVAYTAVKKGLLVSVNNPVIELELHIKMPF